MIDKNRQNHILEVARKMRKSAMQKYPEDSLKQEAWYILGFLHDIGYDFTENKPEHNKVGGKILKRMGYPYWREVFYHGEFEKEYSSEELFYLNYADMTTDGKGETVSLDERLEDVEKRYGKTEVYYKCKKVIDSLKIIKNT